jgi:hypothetical protein
MSDVSVPPGNYLHELIVLKTREVAKSANAAGYIAMWPEAVNKVIKQYPNLSAADRAILRGTIEAQIKRQSAKNHLDIHQFTGALDSVARILGEATC